MATFEYNNFNKRAFTLVEVMLLLVVLSLIMASSYSMITRKHNLKPRRATHGQYICFYDQNEDGSSTDSKHEILISGKTVIKNQNNIARCTFEVPKSSSYIHVRMLGGGGAGGNANYSPVESASGAANSHGQSHPVDEPKDINLISTIYYNNYYPTDWSAQGIMPKISSGKSEWDESWKNFAEYHCDNSSTGNPSCTNGKRLNFYFLPMGVTPDYVENKFRVAASGLFQQYCNDYENGCDAVFSKQLFLHLVRQLIPGVFAYDYAGSGLSGTGVKFKAFNYNSIKFDGESNLKKAYFNVITHKGSVPGCNYYISDTLNGLPKVDNGIDPATGEAIKIPQTLGSSYSNMELLDVDETNLKTNITAYCPSFFLYYQPTLTDATCAGAPGGLGSIFASEVKPYDFYVYPVLGWRWGTGRAVMESSKVIFENFNKAADDSKFDNTELTKALYSRSSSAEDLSQYSERGLFFKFKTDPDGSTASKNVRTHLTYVNDSDLYNIPDLLSLGRAKQSTDLPKPLFNTSFIHVPSFYSDCNTNDANCIIALEPNGTVPSDKVVTVKANKISTPGSVDYTDFSIDAPGIPETYTFPGTKPNGKIPYFAGGEKGVKLHFGVSSSDGKTIQPNNLTRAILGNAGGIISNVSESDVIGKSATGDIDTKTLTAAQAKAMFWTSDGKGQCPNLTTGSGENGKSQINNKNDVICVKNLGLKLESGKGSIIKNFLNATQNEFQCLDTLDANYEPYKRAFNDNHARYKLDESKVALNLKLRYYYKSISYGVPGASGDYTEFFTRSYKSNKINVIPGRGGIATTLDDKETINKSVLDGTYNSTYLRVTPTDEQKGGDTIIYYNCEVDSTTGQQKCASRRVEGGIGGFSGIWEEVTYNRYPGKKVFEILHPSGQESNTDDIPKFLKCSITAPNKFGCPEPSDENKKKFGVTNANAFLEAAPLLALPEIPNFDLTKLGAGGEGGWVVDNCWFTPQYFKFGRSVTGLEDLLNTDNSGILQNFKNGESPLFTDYEGYTAILDEDVNTCKDNYITFDGDNDNVTGSDPTGYQYYYEEPGKNGVAGAVVIMW